MTYLCVNVEMDCFLMIVLGKEGGWGGGRLFHAREHTT